ncbi:MAG: hypothetical protein J5651_06365 [Salinivirgaceae bacterium]|nr:hypothetical protein [Salinivirgaceae bacterium]
MRFLKKTAAIVLMLTAVLPVCAQQFTNDWVRFGQEYYRLAVPRTGVYRVYRSQLESAGVPIGNYSPQNIQLIQNGKPIPCYIDGEASGLCRFIEFYAEGNNGRLDVEMYDNPENQANPHYSLVTDEGAVFLTFNSSFSNLRYQQIATQSIEGYEAAEYCMVDTVCQYTGTYLSGEENCLYTAGEGWFDATALTIGKSVTKTIPTPDIYADTSLWATFRMALGTYSKSWHHLTVSFIDFSADTIFTGLRTLKYSAQIRADKFAASNKLTVSSVNDMSVETDYSRLAYVEVVYPSGFNFAKRRQQVFQLPPSASDKSVTISGMTFSEGGMLYDITRNMRIPLLVSGSEASAVVPAHSEPVLMIVIDNGAFATVSDITNANMSNHNVSGKSMVIISHSSLMPAARRYADYRDAYLVDVEDIYNQFGYGITRHPLAIRKFLEYISSTWTVKPEYLFIIGKGLPVNSTRKNTTNDKYSLIPPMGNPASDALLSAYIGDSGCAPTLATGRLAALTVNDVDTYLAKVKAFEDNKPAEWMKRVLHFCGGNNKNEQRSIRNYMSGYVATISDTLFGGAVTSFYKATSDPISTSKNDSVNMLVNGGVSLMTFFGHGSASGFDQDIDAPTTFHNDGRYPLILSNSCYTGNIFGTTQNSVSEKWVMIARKGAIGFIATVNEGVASYLDRFSSAFYRNLASDMYGQTIGRQMLAAQKAMADANSRLAMSTVHEMVLHGDPCVVLNSPQLPDLQISSSDVSFSPALLSTDVDSFTVSVTLRNIGRAITSPFDVELERRLADGTSFSFSKTINNLNYKQTVDYRLPIGQSSEAGMNTFTVTLDAQNAIEELSEENNQASVNAFVASHQTRAVSPFNYSLNPQVPSELVASTSSALSAPQTDIFQLDTTARFNSPALLTEEIVHSGSVVRWQPQARLDTGTTYFWRVGDGSDNGWSESSFVARTGLTGWEQSHFEQLDDNDFEHITIDSANRRFHFAPAYRTVRCHNIGSPKNDNDYMGIYYSLDGYGGSSSCGVNAALLLVVIDSTTLLPWRSDRSAFGQWNYPNCSLADYEQYFIFYMWTPAEGVNRLINMVETYVPDGDYFMVYSFISGKFRQWPDSAYQKFEEWGSEGIRILGDNTPYIFFTQKGHPEQTEEIYGSSATSVIDFRRTLQTAYNHGTITSPAIGPSSRWTALQWQADADTMDVNCVNVLGVEANGATTTLMSGIDTAAADLSGIDAERYSYLRLQFETRDDSLRTPSQLKMWRVLYEPYTDLAVNQQREWSFYADTLAEGERGRVSVAFENIGLQPADSVLVHYWIQTSANQIIEIGYHRLKALQPSEYVTDTVSFATAGLVGDNVFYAELNPKPEGSLAYDQPELTHFNNFVIRQFCVVGDNRNPLMDVTIDGRHIKDGEIVSAKPEIVIRMTDDNQYFALADTGLISVYIANLETGIEERVDLSQTTVSFEPGTLDSNEARLVFILSLDDGTYQLRVRSHDVSGNESGTDDYLISFQVFNECAITDVYAYPNPFNSSTRFVFELTGTSLPDELRIDIYSPAGTIVRTLTMADFPGLHIGRNVSSCVWDGTNSHGALLPCGVYYYKVTATKDGNRLSRRPTQNASLRNGVGRLVIVR